MDAGTERSSAHLVSVLAGVRPPAGLRQGARVPGKAGGCQAELCRPRAATSGCARRRCEAARVVAVSRTARPGQRGRRRGCRRRVCPGAQLFARRAARGGWKGGSPWHRQSTQDSEAGVDGSTKGLVSGDLRILLGAAHSLAAGVCSLPSELRSNLQPLPLAAPCAAVQSTAQVAAPPRPSGEHVRTLGAALDQPLRCRSAPTRCPPCRSPSRWTRI